MKQGNRIDKAAIDLLIHTKLEAIFGFSMKRTEDRYDAEDLTQDIITEVYRSYTKLKRYEGVEALEGWMWAIARHTYYNWVNRKKKSTLMYIEGMIADSESLQCSSNVDEEYVREEEFNILIKEIGLLSQNYRDIIVLYYLEGKTSTEISKILNLPLSTIKWRLHEAKKSIREGIESMKNYTERSYSPANLWIKSAGTFNSTYSNQYVYDLLKGLLRQNIILCCHREPLSIVEISIELGVPRAYIEEEVDSLMEEEILKERGKGKYQPDFMIFTREMKEEIFSIVEEAANEIIEQILDIVPNYEDRIRNIGFIGSDKPWEELLWVLVPHCLEQKKFCFADIEIPIRPHGNQWRLMGFEGLKKEYPWSGSLNSNVYANGRFKQTIYSTNALGVRIGYLNEKEAEFYREWIVERKKLKDLDEKSEEIAAQLINRGFLKKLSKNFQLNVITFNEEEFKEFEKVTQDMLSHFNIEKTQKAFKEMCTKLYKWIPVHRRSETSSDAGMLFAEVMGCTMKILQEKGKIKVSKNLQTCTKGMYIVVKNK